MSCRVAESDSRQQAVPIPASNPFASRFVRPDVMSYRFDGRGSIDQLAARLRSNQWRGQIVGPHGTGKTTLLWNLVRRLEPEFDDLRLVQLQSRCSSLARGKELFLKRAKSSKVAQPKCLLMIDGFECLRPQDRIRIRFQTRWQSCGLIVSSHRSAGLPSLWTTRADRTGLARLVGELTQGRLRLDADQLQDLLHRHRGNLREILFELYDRWDDRR